MWQQNSIVLCLARSEAVSRAMLTDSWGLCLAWVSKSQKKSVTLIQMRMYY